MNMFRASSFTFGTYTVDTKRSTIAFTYHVKFKFGITKTFTDRLFFPDVEPELWETVPKAVLEPTLQALSLMIGINYWQAICALRGLRSRVNKRVSGTHSTCMGSESFSTSRRSIFVTSLRFRTMIPSPCPHLCDSSVQHGHFSSTVQVRTPFFLLKY